MISQLRKLRNYQTILAQGDSSLRVLQAEEKHELDDAKKLFASVYLDHNYISEDQLDTNGHIAKQHDPYHDYSKYFVVTKQCNQGKRVVATARQIGVNNNLGLKSFPTLAKLGFHTELMAKISNFDPKDCVEISGLAKLKMTSSYAIMLLYRAMWKYSIEQNHKLWLMACDERLYTNLKFLFGSALTEFGDKIYYMGSYVIPVALEIDSSLAFFFEPSKDLPSFRLNFHKACAQFFREGVPEYLWKKMLYPTSA